MAGGPARVLNAPGEHIYLPASYDYTLEASGVKTVFFWSSGPSPRAGLVEYPEYSSQLKSLRKCGRGRGLIRCYVRPCKQQHPTARSTARRCTRKVIGQLGVISDNAFVVDLFSDR